MAMMMGALYQALREGGASDEHAQKATEEVANDTKQLSDIRTDLALVKTLLGIVVAGVVALVMKAFIA
ncbi:hypothetical protein [Sphingomonas bacterium]|uniref:hypothetical protein n=1 Tax=Sphingomonas bacterium TaxID=1895847 RepID=UPI0015771B47|nr:hypothetical protein [Sphingomonas bacterium]